MNKMLATNFLPYLPYLPYHCCLSAADDSMEKKKYIRVSIS